MARFKIILILLISEIHLISTEPKFLNYLAKQMKTKLLNKKEISWPTKLQSERRMESSNNKFGLQNLKRVPTELNLTTKNIDFHSKSTSDGQNSTLPVTNLQPTEQTRILIMRKNESSLAFFKAMFGAKIFITPFEKDEFYCKFERSNCGWNSIPSSNPWKLVSFGYSGKNHYLVAPRGRPSALLSKKIRKINETRCLSFQYETKNSGLASVSQTSSNLLVYIKKVNGSSTMVYSSTKDEAPLKNFRVRLNFQVNQESQISFEGVSSSYSFTTKLFYIRLKRGKCKFEGSTEGEDFLRTNNAPMRFQKNFWLSHTLNCPD